jgi:hypothetical protein
MSISAILENARTEFTRMKSREYAQGIADDNNALADPGEVYTVVEKGQWFAIQFTIDGEHIAFL